MEIVARTPQQLSQALRAHRAHRKFTQAEAGQGVGLLQKTVSALEQKPGTSSIDSLFRLLSALNLELVVREKTSSRPGADSTEW